MLARTQSDRLDGAVDLFEANWGADAFEKIRLLLAGFGLENDWNCVAELVRVDIQRRHAAKLPVSIKSYFELYAPLQQNVELGCLVAYEDFRTRVANSLPVSRDRWNWIDGVEKTSWYLSIEEPSRLAFGSSSHSVPFNQNEFSEESSRQINGQLKLGAERGNATVGSASKRVDVAMPHVEPADLARALTESGFDVVRQIGVGAFSRVFLATQDSLANRYVVIKAVLRTFKEADRLAQLQHTNIVPIYSYHRSGRWSLLCMPYAGQMTLAEYFAVAAESNSRSGQSFVATIRQSATNDTVRLRVESEASDMEEQATTDSHTSMPFKNLLSSLEPLQRDELALWIFSHLSSALAHAHARNILHGDLKPANILLRNDGEPALLDFNLSAEIDAKESIAVGGTLPYMAPELMHALLGAKHLISVTSDIYSLGAVFYQFLVGNLPFPTPRSAAPVDLEHAIAERRESVAWPADHHVSPSIRAIVSRCLAYSPKDRYACVQDLHEDLDCERNSMPLKHAREVSLKHRFRKWMKRHPILASVGTVSIASLLTVVSLSFALWKISEHRRSLFADKQFAEFDERSEQALARLLVVDRRDRDQALSLADRCLSHYKVLSDIRWQEQADWRYLDESRQEIVERRLTDLLLRTAWAHYDRRNTDHAQSHTRELIARVRLLSDEPFNAHAPLSIDYLRETTAGSTSQSLERNQPRYDESASPLDVLGQASQAIERLNSFEAMHLLTPNLLKFIDPYTYWVTLGRAQLEGGYLPAAELSFSMAIEQFPDLPAAFHYRGVCRMTMRNAAMTSMAIDDFTSALNLAEHAFETRVNRAMAKEDQGDLKGALEDLKYLAGEPDVDAQALMVRSRIYRGLEEYDLAQRDFDSAIHLPPRSVSAWMTRALARLPGDAQGAIDDLRAAEEMSPNSIEVHQNLAHVYSEYLGAPEKAIDSLTRLLQLNPKYERALLGRAVLFARLGMFDRAVSDLRVAESTQSQLTPSGVYQAACVYSLISLKSADIEHEVTSIETALTYLSRAVQQGYGADLLSIDPDLNPLRTDPRFEAIVSTVGLGRIGN